MALAGALVVSLHCSVGHGRDVHDDHHAEAVDGERATKLPYRPTPARHHRRRRERELLPKQASLGRNRDWGWNRPAEWLPCILSEPAFPRRAARRC